MNKNKHVYDGKIAGLYDLEDTLGRGHFAVVKLARHVFTGEKVAVKVIDKTKLDEVSRSHLFQEVRCMKLVQHPNVVRLYEVIDTQTKLYLILELGDGGDMYDYIMKHEKGLDEELAKKYFRQIVHAISYCHRLHVVHRDLKPENVVFFEKLGMVKLTDFGFSNRFCPGQKLETSCGSLAYSAPEILLGDMYDAPAVDVWSLGVILYMLVCGHAPFQEANDSETLTMIMDCKYTIPSYVSPECAKLIQKMLIRDPEKRATLESIATDPWLQSGSNVQYSEHLPLVSREHLSEEDHAHIIQKMVSGNIALHDEILEALDKDAYNHVTATYFLLAERKLRALRQERAKLLNATHVSDLSALAISPRNPMNPPGPTADSGLPRTVDGLLSPQEKRRTLTAPVVPCSLEVLQNRRGRSQSDVNAPPSPTLPESQPADVAGSVPSRSLQRKCDSGKCGDAKKKKRLSADLERHVTIYDEEGPEDDDEDCSRSSRASDSDDAPPNNGKVKSSQSSGPNNRKLHSVRSSPQLTLNEIYEEGESECEAAATSKFHTSTCVSNSTSSSPSTRVLKAHHSVASPAVMRKYERRVRYAKARTASCSSSDASDDDTDQRKRKAEKLKQMPGWRDGRKSNDDDDDGHGAGPNGGSGQQNTNQDGPSAGTENRGQSSAPNGPTSDDTSSHQHGGSRRPASPSCASESQNRNNANVQPLVCRTAAVALMDRRLHKSSDELHASGRHGHYHHNRAVVVSSSSASDTSSPPPFNARRSRSPASITRSLVESSSPPPSPLATPNITSLRQSKTLNQLNRFLSPPASLPSSPVLDMGDKENHHLNNQALSRHCTGGPLHLLNLRRPGKWRPPSYPMTSSGTAGGGSTTGNDQVALAGPRSHYKAGLCRLLKYAPGLGLKRWDINRNGLNSSPTSSVGSPRSSNYSVRLRVASASPAPPSASPSSSHSKCCSLC